MIARRNRPSDRLPESIRDHPEVVRACGEWNIGRLFRFINNLSEEPAKFTVTHLGRLCGLSVSRVSEYMDDTHQVTAKGIIERISDGLRIPGERFGLTPRPWEKELAASKPQQATGSDVLLAGEGVRDIQDCRELARVFSLDQGQTARLRGLIERPRLSKADDEITIPAWTVDGGIVFVRISRRDFLEGAASLSVAPLALSAPSSPNVDFGIHPVAHFIEMKKVLMDSDNLFGPARVISTVLQQVEIMHQLRRNSQGMDRKRLIQVQTQYADLLGWLYQDSGDFQNAGLWIARSLEWAHMTRDTQAAAFILARRSQLAADMGNPTDAIDAAEAALGMARPDTRISAISSTFVAHGHAMRSDYESSSRAYDQACESLSKTVDDHSPYALCFDEHYLGVQRAHSLVALGRPELATELFETAINQLPQDYRRDRGVYLAWSAYAYAQAGETKQATEVGHKSLAVARETRSSRITSGLARLDDYFARQHSAPEVREFRTALAELTLQQA